MPILTTAGAAAYRLQRAPRGGVYIVLVASPTPSTENASSYNFGTVSFGTPAPGRILVCAAGASGVATATLSAGSCLIGASAPSLISENSVGTGTANYNGALFGIVNENDASGNLTVAWSSGKGRCTAFLFAVYGAQWPASDTDNASGDPAAMAVDVAARGGIIGAMCWNMSVTQGTGQMVGLANVAQDAAENVNLAGLIASRVTPATSSFDVTATISGESGTLANLAACVASFSP
jgi:hypothetical protein